MVLDSVPSKLSPPLESGDRLTRREFENRYIKSDIRKAELIEGVVYVASPLRFEQHAEPHARVVTWLGTYQSLNPRTRLGIEPTVRLDLDNELQPDAVLLISGGRADIDADGYVNGAPELVVEIAASTASLDMGDKKRAYRRNGVQEYLVWQIYENCIDWFVLEDDDYVNLLPDEAGILKSQVFPGLWLAVDALKSGEMAIVLQTLHRGIALIDQN